MRRLGHLSLLLSSLLLACAPGTEADDESCEGGKCDDLTDVDDQDLTPFPCDDVFFNSSTRRNPDGSEITRFVDRFRDPLTKLAYQGDDCPLTMEDIIAKMKENETDCGTNDGLATRMVSEEGQIVDPQFAGYRGVTTKKCGDREEHDMFFSIFGIGGADDELPTQGIEVIARDELTGVYNYYKEIDGKMGFFGSGLDYTFDGVGEFLTDVNGCGSCHAEQVIDGKRHGRGNVNMKELRAPWLHWEGTATNGAEDVIKRFEDTMGTRKTGPNMESLAKAGNKVNNGKVIDALVKRQEYQKLLGPLFCNEQLNLATGKRDKVPSQFLLAPRIGKGTAFDIKVSGAGYDNLLKAIGSAVPGTDIVDTRFPFAYVERSFDDQNYVDQLIEKGIIDEQFALDVLAVDFTRPIFSDARCDLLAFAPGQTDVSADELSAEALRKIFIENLAGADDGTPGAQLRAHLEATESGSSIDHEANAKTFIAACNDIDDNGDKVDIDAAGTAKSVSQFQANAMKIKSIHRQLVFESDGVLDDAEGSDFRARKVFEFPRAFASDEIKVTASADPNDPLAVHPDAHFSPLDCTLVTEYVPVPVD